MDYIGREPDFDLSDAIYGMSTLDIDELLTALAKASAAVTEALALVKNEASAPVTRQSAAVSTTSLRALAVLAAAKRRRLATLGPTPWTPEP